jgi:asparagine synthase (glutamine-hydrolysing)
MAHALEVREPLLDHELMGWVSGLPVDFKLRGSEGKYLLKKAMEPYLPNDVLYRKKMGFSVPLAAWFRGPLAATIRSVVLGERLASTGMFNQAFLRDVVEVHQSGRRDYSVILWTVLMFDAFLGQVLGMDSDEIAKAA